MIGNGQPLPACDLIVLPGSKSVRSDLAILRANGWDDAITRHLRYGGKVLGICGGMQMLGDSIADPHGIEGPAGTSQGLGWLALATMLEPHKQLRRVNGRLAANFASKQNVAVSGYEIHAGVTSGTALTNPLVQLADRNDGAISSDGNIAGTYLHGLFDDSDACAALLSWAGLQEPAMLDYHARREVDIERLADSVSANLDFDLIDKLIL
jgi:adenosylcobyric acid synthase